MSVNKMKELKNLQALSFALVETALYLDGHPNDKKAIGYYDKIKNEYKTALEKYEMENGPVTQASEHVTHGGTWQWVSEPWPWQN